MGRSLRRWAARLGSIAALAVVGSASAQDIAVFDNDREAIRRQGATLTAEVLEYEVTRDVYTASGQVVIVQGERTLKADWVAFHPETGAGVASGNVELIDSEQTMRADFVEFDTETLQGLVRNAWLDSPVSRFRTTGATIEKTGDNTFRFEDGVFTTCRCPVEGEVEPWRLRAREADVEINGYGTLRDARFEIFGVPVLYLPWMLYPIKTERQTGLLFPEVSTASRNGFEVGLPIFWAPRSDFGATFTPRWSARRGLKADLEIEAKPSENFESLLFGGYTSDQSISPRSLDEPFGRRRWALRGEQRGELPGAVQYRAAFNFASDNQYTLDFDDLLVARASRYLESQASLARAFGPSERAGIVAAVQFADDFQAPNDLDRDKFLLQRLPSIDVSWLPGPAPVARWLKPSLDFEYTLFDARDRPRSAGAFVDSGVDGVLDPFEQVGPIAADRHLDNAVRGGTEGDGEFQEGEALTDDGHRVVLHPKLAAPFRLGPFVELMPEAGWQQTLYATRLEGGDQRGRFTARVDARTRLRRRFGEWVHIVEPRVGYAFVDSASQRDLPLLVPGTALPQDRIRSLTLDTVTNDPADRVAHSNEIVFGLGQRGFQIADDAGSRLAGDLTVLGRYDFENNEFGDVLIDGRVQPARLGSARFHVAFDPDASRVNEALGEWNWKHREGHRVGVVYRYLRDLQNVFEDFGTTDRFDSFRDANRVDQLGSSFRVAITRNWSLDYRVSYSFAADVILANEGTLEYLSSCGCWAAGLAFSQDRARGVEVRAIYRIVGLGDDDQPNRGGLLDALGGL